MIGGLGGMGCKMVVVFLISNVEDSGRAGER